MGLVGFRKPPVRGRTGRNPPIKPILIQDMQNPQKRPSKKTKNSIDPQQNCCRPNKVGKELNESVSCPRYHCAVPQWW